jgi:hypothetical protein
MSEQTQADAHSAPAAGDSKKPVFTKARMAGAAVGLGGMVLGAVVGLAVQTGVRSTGILGPSVDALMAEQQSNFDDMTARLDELRQLPVDAEVKAGLDELGNALARQDELARQSNAEIAYLVEQVASMREQQLAESGFSGGADFWLKSGESVTVGPDAQVFGLAGRALDCRRHQSQRLPQAGLGGRCNSAARRTKPMHDFLQAGNTARRWSDRIRPDL